MKIGKQISKFIASILSVVLLFGCIPFAASAEGENSEFVSENLLRTKIDLGNSSGILFYHNGRTVADSTNGGIASNGVVAGLVDGNTSVNHDMWALSQTDSRWYGVRYALTEAAYADHITLYAGLANTEEEDGTVNYLNDVYDVYAAEDLEQLYFAENMVGKNVVCAGEPVDIAVGRTVQYVAIVFNASAAKQTNARPKEIELWSGDASSAPVYTNLLRQTLSNGEAVMTEAKPVNVNLSTGDATENTLLSEKLTTIINSDKTNHEDMNPNIGDSLNLAFQFSFLDSVYVKSVVIDAGLWNGYNEVYDIYASDDLDTLYRAESKVVSSAACTNSTGANVSIGKKAKYIALVVIETKDYPRVRRLKVIGEYKQNDSFVSKNVLKTNLKSSRCIQFYPSNYYVDGANKISTETLAKFTNGDISDKEDCYTGLDWDPPRYIGAEFTLDDTYFVGELNIYSGYTTMLDTFEVYASDNIETLYSAESLVARNVVCDGTKKTLTVNKNIKYVTFLISGVGLYCARIAEFEAFTADPDEVFVSKNVLKTNLKSSRCIQFYPSNYYVDGANKISTETLAKFTNGDISDKEDCYTGLDWDPPRYIGAEFTLDDTYFVGELNIYSGYTTMLDTFEVYASDNIETLYSAESLVAENVVCDGTKKTLTVNKNIKYVTFLISGVGLYCARIAEFEAFTADPNEAPKPEDTSKKVLTIGNSFAQNASTYATEIAYANGEELTFGYLMFPSCTIDMHYEAAAADRHIFRFKVTTPDNMRGTLLKDYPANQNFDQDLPETAASIKEALEYTDWDIIVFQQESSSARNYGTFSRLGDLINYVREYCPEAKLMFHQVWRWGTWDADQFSLIKANSETAAREYGLDIIPTGLAFEYAREDLGNVNAVNENDGAYQHANTYGMYIAGCVYTAAIFGKEISENTFTDHPYVNVNKEVALLTAAANKAVDYYNSIGDLNDDGVVNSSDMVLLKKHLLGSETFDTTLADANGDGQVNILDLVRIKRYLDDNTVSLGR